MGPPLQSVKGQVLLTPAQHLPRPRVERLTLVHDRHEEVGRPDGFATVGGQLLRGLLHLHRQVAGSPAVHRERVGATLPQRPAARWPQCRPGRTIDLSQGSQ